MNQFKFKIKNTWYDSEDIIKLAFMRYVGGSDGYYTDDISQLPSQYSGPRDYVLVNQFIEPNELYKLKPYLREVGLVGILRRSRDEVVTYPGEFKCIGSILVDEVSQLHLHVVAYKIGGIKHAPVDHRQAVYTVLRVTPAIGDTLQAWMIARSLCVEHPSDLVELIVDIRMYHLLNPMIDLVPNIRIWYTPSMAISHYNQYADYLSKSSHNFINLAGSMEGRLLKTPGSVDYYWSKTQREATCSLSYNREAARMSGVHQPLLLVDETGDERVNYRRSDMSKVIISWSLRGSAVHKWYPYVSDVVERLLDHYGQEVEILLLGDESSRLIVNEVKVQVARHTHRDQVYYHTGNLETVRDAILRAKHSDLVIGPETGLMFANCHAEVHKILLLSHSCRDNFSDWTNTTFVSSNVECHPCHRLHNSFEHCQPCILTGSAVCQSSINPKSLYEVINEQVSKTISERVGSRILPRSSI